MGQINSAIDLGRPFTLRACGPDDYGAMLKIINVAARAYLGAIPDGEWRDPYMSGTQLQEELEAGVSFQGAEIQGVLVAVMGVESRSDVDLIRHAYVLPEYQGCGLGGALLGFLVSRSRRPVLVGTWEGARWAVRFYERHGFVLETDPVRRAERLRKYWRVSEGQMDAAVVLALPLSNQ